MSSRNRYSDSNDGRRGASDDAIITGDEVEFHDGAAIILPHGLTYGKAKNVLERMQVEAETIMQQKRIYPYRPFDGAVAAYHVMKQTFGITIGKQTPGGFFSPPEPPETRTVAISSTETIDVPWGRIDVPAFENTQITVGGMRTHDQGLVTYIAIETPKKNAVMAAGFLDAIGEELAKNSIYRGKAIVGTEEPEFLDLTTIVPSEIVFSDEVMTTLDGALWTVIRHREALKSDGVRVKRALLLHGPYGTGKTSAGQLTALEAVANGWTFIAARPGRDDVNEVLKTAKLYAPAVVFVEDIDNQTATSDDDDVAQLLESFDGVTSKGQEIALLMTTNHFDRIHKGMLRPGRIDAVVEVAGLDRNGVERLVRSVVKADRLAEDVDFDSVYDAMSVIVTHENGDTERVDFYPAYVRETLERAKTYAVGRSGGKLDYVLTTEDIVGAAVSLYGQLRAQHLAEEGEKPPVIDSALKKLVQDAIQGTQILDYEDDPTGQKLGGRDK